VLSDTAVELSFVLMVTLTALAAHMFATLMAMLVNSYDAARSD